MQTNVLEQISPQLDYSRTERLARQWAVTFAELYCIALADRGPRFVDLWVSALADLGSDILEAACRRAMEVCKFFPTPAEIRAQIDKANANGLQLEAAEAWDRWLKDVTSYFHPDLGWDRRAPQLDAITEHAGIAAGGAHWVERCPEDELQWARKRFLDDYLLAHRTGQVQNLLTRGEAKKILASLTAEAPAKQLTRPPAVEEPSKPDEATLQAFDEASQAINAPVPPPAGAILTETEWEARKARQLRAISEAFPGWREDHQRKIHLYIQLRAGGFPKRRIAQELFPGWPRKDQLLLLEIFAYIHRGEIEGCANVPLPSSASLGQESLCAD